MKELSSREQNYMVKTQLDLSFINLIYLLFIFKSIIAIKSPELSYAIYQASMNSQSTTHALQEYENVYTCPLTMQIMEEPYVLPCQHTFQLAQIRKYLQLKQECPMCRKYFKFEDGAKNLFAKQTIEIYKRQLFYKKGKQIQIFIKEGSLPSLLVKVKQSEAIANITEQLRQKYPNLHDWSTVRRIRYTFQGKPLDTKNRFKDYGIRAYSTIYMTAYYYNCSLGVIGYNEFYVQLMKKREYLKWRAQSFQQYIKNKQIYNNM